MAAPVKDIVSMFETEKHKASSEKTFAPKMDGFDDDTTSEPNEAISKESSEFAEEMLRELLK